MNDKVIASYVLCNTLSVNIYSVEYKEDKNAHYVLVGFNNDEPVLKKLKIDRNGEPCFYLHKQKYLLKDFIIC